MGLAGPVLDQCRRRRCVGYIIRRNLDETPEFQAEADQARGPAAPLGVLFRYHWRGVLRVFFAAFIATVNTMFAVFALNFATSDDYGIGISDTLMLWMAIVANIIAIAIDPVVGHAVGPGRPQAGLRHRCWSAAAVLVVAFLGVDRHEERGAGHGLRCAARRASSTA